MSLFDEDESLDNWDDEYRDDYEYDEEPDQDYSYSPPSGLDERFEEAARMVVLTQNGGTSNLQRRLGMGYTKACRVMDQLEATGIVSPQNGGRPRQVLVRDLNELDLVLNLFLPGYRKDTVSSYEPITRLLGSHSHTSPDEDAIVRSIIDEEVDFNPKDNKPSNREEYSDSVNAMNGCLGYVGQVISYMYIILLFIMLAPVVIVVLLAWWFIAWILGLIFPGKEFFPIKKIYHSVAPWFKRTFGLSLEDAAIASILVVVATALLDGLSGLFSKKD